MKRRSWKSRKSEIFPKGLVQGFGQNWPFFQFFILRNIGQENVFYDILERKNRFLRYQNKQLENSKKWDFSEGVSPGFWPKTGHFFPLFVLGNIGQENVSYDILERKKRLSKA